MQLYVFFLYTRIDTMVTRPRLTKKDMLLPQKSHQTKLNYCKPCKRDSWQHLVIGMQILSNHAAWYNLRQKKKPRVFFLIDFCPYCFYIFFDNFSFQRKYFILLAFYNICEITYLVLIDHLLDKEGTQRKLLIWLASRSLLLKLIAIVILVILSICFYNMYWSVIWWMLSFW